MIAERMLDDEDSVPAAEAEQAVIGGASNAQSTHYLSTMPVGFTGRKHELWEETSQPDKKQKVVLA